MDFILGFFIGYFCKEIISYLKKLANNSIDDSWNKEWDWIN